jgi:hypothetical protein
MRLHKMAMPTMPVARVLTRWLGLAGSVTDATEQRSQDLRKGNVEMLFCSRRPAGDDFALDALRRVARRATATEE